MLSLSGYSSKSVTNQIIEQKKLAKKNDDLKTEALLNTGIVDLELSLIAKISELTQVKNRKSHSKKRKKGKKTKLKHPKEEKIETSSKKLVSNKKKKHQHQKSSYPKSSLQKKALLKSQSKGDDIMIDLNMEYNPYRLETKLFYKGTDLMSQENSEIDTSRLSQNRQRRLQTWLEELLPMLEEAFNETSFSITFTGSEDDFVDLESVCLEQPDFNIKLTHIEIQEVGDKFTAISALTDTLVNAPFKALSNPKIKESVEHALSSEFEIAVVATMSSGKSTLINALLGQDLMPAKNEACTAKISRIKNNPNLTGYSAIAYDKKGKEFKAISEASAEDFIVFNDDKTIDSIEIEGKIPGISSGKMNLVLVDTPGPNNSQDSSHREHALRAIASEDGDRPMILYVLNATQLRTEDDQYFLDGIAESMKVGDQQSSDRYLFVVNKADEFDPEKGESIEKALQNVRDYLNQFGITSPNIYPTSAKLAKLIRQKQQNLKLTRTERSFISEDSLALFIEEEELHLNKYSPLNSQIKGQLEQAVESAKERSKTLDEALIYSGVPSLEAGINQYLEKYAVTNKITKAVDSFRRIVEQEKLATKLQNSLNQDTEARATLHTQLATIEKVISDGKHASEFRTKIKSMKLVVPEEFDMKLKEIVTEITNEIDKLKSDELKKEQAEHVLKEFSGKMTDKIQKLKISIEKMTEKSIKTEADRLTKEYQKYVSGIFEDKNMSIQFKEWRSNLSDQLMNSDTLVADHLITKEEKVGEKTRYYDNSKWYNPFSWGDKGETTVDIYDEVEYVEVKVAAKKYVEEMVKIIIAGIKEAEEKVVDGQKQLKADFLNKMDKVDKELQKQVENLSRMTDSEEQLEKTIAKNKEAEQWLNNFIEELDHILDLKVKN